MTYKKISILAFILLMSFVGTILVQNEQIEDGNGSEKITISRSSGSINQGGIESDTIKRLKTHSESGTGWGMNPFGSGKPLEEESPQKVVFRMPNTEWKTRTLSGITYEFGKGNPKEVALDVSQLSAYSLCKAPFLDSSYGNIEGQCAEGRGYVTDVTEIELKKLLSDKNWSELIQNCQTEIALLKDDRLELYILSPHALDISEFLIIDPYSGRKEIARNQDGTNKLWLLQNALLGISQLNDDVWANTCINQYSKPLYHQVGKILGIYNGIERISMD